MDHFAQDQDSVHDGDEIKVAVIKSPKNNVNEQVRKIRDELQKEFEDKFKSTLDDIDLYKAQLEHALKETEQRQHAIFQRQLTDKDKLIQQLNGHKTVLETEINHIEKIVQEKEELIQNQKETIDQLRQVNENNTTKSREVELREEVLNNYMESSKSSYDDMKFKLENAMQSLQELGKQDWTKQIMELKNENEFLRDEITQKQKEFSNLKNNLAMAIQMSGGTNV